MKLKNAKQAYLHSIPKVHILSKNSQFFQPKIRQTIELETQNLTCQKDQFGPI